MEKRIIVFRADADQCIGMGHFIRTLALAEMLNEYFYCIFATRKPSDYQVAEIDKVCSGRISLPEDDSHFEFFLNCLKGDEIVVLDNYYFSTDYQYRIKEQGCKLVCIDDLHNKHYVSDVVINHGVGSAQSDFSIEKHTVLLLGYKFALLRSPFLSQEYSLNEKEYSALIIMGGADPLLLSSKIVDILLERNLSKRIALVSGSKVCEGLPPERVNCFRNLTAQQLWQLMNNSEFGVFPSSTVSLEACAARLPFICGFFVENQRQVYEAILKAQIAIGVGDYTKINSTSLGAAIDELHSGNTIEKLTRKQELMLDKRSRERLINVFLKL